MDGLGKIRSEYTSTFVEFISYCVYSQDGIKEKTRLASSNTYKLREPTMKRLKDYEILRSKPRRFFEVIP
jgi:hypothetical protein